MDKKIVSTDIFLNTLKEKFGKLEYSSLPAKKWFSYDEKVFFDCEEHDKEKLLDELLKRRDLEEFIAYFIIKKMDGNYELMKVNYNNALLKESFGHFIRRFFITLEKMARISIQLQGKEYIECAGFSY